MYAIVKTGGKQYKVAPGDKLNIEKLNAEPGAKVELEAICVVDGEKVEADPAKAAATKVVAVVLEQFKGEKQLVFKFKKRKNYKKLRGHRQQLTRVQIESVGSAKAEKPAEEGRREEGRGRRGAQGRNQGRCEVHGRQGEACRQDGGCGKEARRQEGRQGGSKARCREEGCGEEDRNRVGRRRVKQGREFSWLTRKA